jgi:hypothetical protein
MEWVRNGNLVPGGLCSLFSSFFSLKVLIQGVEELQGGR